MYINFRLHFASYQGWIVRIQACMSTFMYYNYSQEMWEKQLSLHCVVVYRYIYLLSLSFTLTIIAIARSWLSVETNDWNRPEVVGGEVGKFLSANGCFVHFAADAANDDVHGDLKLTTIFWL